MISRDLLRELATFRAPAESAVTFYYQPAEARDQSHRDEAIHIKELLKSAERRTTGHVRRDLERIAQLAPQLKEKRVRAKAVFACAALDVWREFDLPTQLPGNAIIVNRRFHLKPLCGVLDGAERTCIALVDRKRARIFDLWLDEISQIDDFIDEAPRIGRSEGFAGYNAGHVERHAEQFALRHYQNVAERLRQRYANGKGFAKLLIGCRDEVRAELTPQLHTYLQTPLLGFFSLDVASATAEQVREAARVFLDEDRARARAALVREALGQAQRDGRGAIGLRRVIESLERGEVQAMLIGEKLDAVAVECANCGHLDTRTVKECGLCGKETRAIDDLSDALIGLALRNQAEVALVDDPEFARAGNIAALLRFRADQNTEARKAG